MKVTKKPIILQNKVDSRKNGIIIDCNIVDPYISNKCFCNPLATFMNFSINQDFCVIIKIATFTS